MMGRLVGDAEMNEIGLIQTDGHKENFSIVWSSYQSHLSKNNRSSQIKQLRFPYFNVKDAHVPVVAQAYFHISQLSMSTCSCPQVTLV